MKPTVGRIVHYHVPIPHTFLKPNSNAAESTMLQTNGPFAAVVTYVHADGDALALSVLYPAAESKMLSIPHAADDKPTPGHWNWPPRE